jgi:hypothetical protein
MICFFCRVETADLMGYLRDPINSVLVFGVVALVVLGGAAGGGYPCLDAAGIPKEIFAGVTYGCERLEPGRQGRGLVYWVRVDLTTPGIEVYVTPKDPAAESLGWQYRLRRIRDVVDKEDLAVAINGTLFSASSGWLKLPGDLANGAYAAVSDHIVSDVFEDFKYLLWFDDQLTPHLRQPKQPMGAALPMVKWGISGPGVPTLIDGVVSPSGAAVPNNPDSRTAIAIDGSRKLLFLAVGESISPRLILQKLANLGARDGMLLDGGNSSSMAIGKDAKGVSAGVVTGGWQPVATFFGIRAKRLGNRRLD